MKTTNKNKSDYSQLLMSPRWQKKRLEILEQHNFECMHCGEKDKTLHVHHKSYIFGKKPWEYEDSNFEALCVDCHKNTTDLDKKIKLALSDIGMAEKLHILGVIKSFKIAEAEKQDKYHPESYEEIEGFLSLACRGKKMGWFIDSLAQNKKLFLNDKILNEFSEVLRG